MTQLVDRPRRPGPRRRRADPARRRHDRRPHPAVRARPLAGPDRRRLRLRVGDRADHRRLDLRPRRLALGVLRLAARRRRRAGRRRRHAEDPAASRARHEGRLRGRGPARASACPPACWRSSRAARRSCTRSRRSCSPSSSGGSAASSSRSSRSSCSRERVFTASNLAALRGRRRHVRRDHVRAALRAGRDGRLGHRLRHRAHAADAVDDGHQRRLGPGDHAAPAATAGRWSPARWSWAPASCCWRPWASARPRCTPPWR